ncbi:MAG TPA: hypothetical protein VN637_15010 [Roseiarcus sp.]|nr:hypothetical protein [Roseiarcus sp.]
MGDSQAPPLTSRLKERRRRVSKDVPERTNGADRWIILRDAVLRRLLEA